MAKDIDELRLNTVRKSLLTPILFMGGERELSLLVILVAAALVVFVQTWLAFFSGVFLYILAFPVLRSMAKKDPQISKVYRRSLNYQSFYPHAGTIHLIKNIKQTSTKFKR